METTETSPEEYNFAADIGKELAITAASYVAAVGALLTAGYVYGKYTDRKERKAAENVETTEE